jgi:CRP/FNR family transcriptional regulator, cyclic AMP receptor protein
VSDSATRLPHRVRARIAKVSHPIDVRAKQQVVAEGEEGLPLFVVTSGALTVSITAADGERAVVSVLGPGDVLGDGGLAPPLAPPIPEVQALVRSRLLAIRSDALAGLLAEDGRIAGWLLSRLMLRVRAFEHHLARVLPQGVGGRVESVLAELAERHGWQVPGGVLVRLPLTQADLAAMVGASRETVNRALADLARRGRVLRSRRGYILSESRP